MYEKTNNKYTYNNNLCNMHNGGGVQPLIASAEGASLSLSSVSGAPGETVTVGINVSCGNNFGSLNAVVEWDYPSLTAGKTVMANGVFGWSNKSDEYECSLNIIAFSDHSIPDGTIATIDFTIPEDACDGDVYSLCFSNIMSFNDYDGSDYSYSAQVYGGSIIVDTQGKPESEEPEYDFDYRESDSDHDGIYDSVEITDCNKNVKAVEIPGEIDGLPVTEIGKEVFSGCTSLESITIPDSVTSIGENAFSGTALLSNQTGPLYYVDNWVVDCDEDVTSAQLEEETRGIADYAFSNCTTLKSIVIPDSSTVIGNYAFYDCSSLESVTVGNGVTSIGSYSFSGCKSLKDFTIPDSVTSISTGAFCECSSLTDVTIPDKVEGIGWWAFSGCTNLKSVTLHDDLKYIGFNSFWNCTSLESVEIPDSVTSIDDLAFVGCSSLVSVNVSDNNDFYSDIDGVLFDKDHTSLIVYPIGKTDADYIVPDGVISIEDYAFVSSQNIENVVIPDSVTSIGEGAFGGCAKLETVTLKSPECEIFGYPYTISNGLNEDSGYYFNGTIYGYENSTAQAYAEEFGYNFKLIGEDEPDITTPAVTTAVTTSKTTVATSVSKVSTTAKTTENTTNASTTAKTTVNTTESETDTTAGTTNSTTGISTATTTVKTTDTAATTPKATTASAAGITTSVNTTVSTVQTSVSGTTTTAPVTTQPAEPEGDSNGDGKLDVRDAAYIAKMLAQGKASELPDSADFNGDGKVNVRDAAAIAKHLATEKK